MRSLMQKTWFRILMLAIYCCCAAGAVVAGKLFHYILQDGWFSDQDNFGFPQTSLCYSYVDDCLRHVFDNLQWLRTPASTHLGGWGGKSFAYKITQDDGTVLADTTGSNSEFVDMWNVMVENPILYTPVMDKTNAVSADSDLVITPAPDSAVSDTDATATQEPQPSEQYDALPPSIPWQTTDNDYYIEENAWGDYDLEGYVNLPVEPYDGCYMEYCVFEQLYALRQLLLPATIVCALLASAGLAVSLTAAVLCGRRGKLTLLGRVPADAAALVLLLSAVLFQDLSYELNDQLRMILSQLFISYSDTVRVVLGLWVVGLMACLSTNQITLGVWKDKLLLSLVLRKLPAAAVLILLMVGHMLILLLIMWYVYVRTLVIILLVVLELADAVMLLWMLRQNRESRCICQASKALAVGDLTYKVDTKRLHAMWKELGQDLNRIGDGMSLAVEEQMRSERMKTELITNVSHDLKTPLTSIINYIDLLKNEDLPEQTRREYMEVLDRQGAKLKKLTEDVVEASKAASGAVKVNAETFDLRVLAEQTVGEYSERLSAAGIEPVMHLPEQEALIMADPRLLGRVLDNLTVNVLKYAQAGTRAYFDLERDTEQVVLAIKNTSREPLDIPAEELMERFVRADSSRTTEGSGLGLAIARSLTELMGGQLELILDGDHFKAQVSFPTAALPSGTTEAISEPPPADENTQQAQA